MSVTCLTIGNVLANRWDGQMTHEDLNKVLMQSESLHRRFGPITGLAIIGEAHKLPDEELRTRLSETRKLIFSHYRSLHFILPNGGVIVTRMLSFLTVSLTSGSGGTLHIHRSLRDALEKAEEYGPLELGLEETLRILESNNFQLKKSA